MSKYIILALTLLSFSANAAAKKAKDHKDELLIKLAPGAIESFQVLDSLASQGNKIEKLDEQWIKIETSKSHAKEIMALKTHPSVEYIQPNYPIHLMENYKIEDPLRRAAIGISALRSFGETAKMPADNPAIPDAPQQGTGADPLFNKQWGMNDIGVKDAWKTTKGSPEMIVAVIDTGVDYTHEDLLPNMWRNPGETGTDAKGNNKANNGIDDDKNGYVDDVVGWDFVSNDNKPFDLAVDPLQLLMGGGNPGHGTHCAGNVGARADNGVGVAGVAPNVKIMALRFISDKGEGTTADAIKAIRYAVDNGAKVLSNSWGSEGEDPGDSTENKALRDTVQYAMDKGTLFIAAAGNGHKGAGYDNDNDPKPSYPATYPHENIVSVAAIDVNNELGSFSNWGAKSVHLGAPGVVVFSTTVGGNYSDTVIDKYGIHATWDGTSMATPHVAGAAALYWSAHPEKSWREVKAALLGSTKKINSLANKTVSGGKLDVKALMKY